ncbi:MAG TPA: iron hydrogenase, partial [Clostridiaceae bacterium]|nr:iron hydrogenase [Clostridiaceae bacterium]
DLVPHLSPSVSPMIAAEKILKKLNPECKVVFIGPCIAKKGEIKNPDVEGAVDFVLTFQELKDIFDAFNINVEELPEDHSLEYASREGRLYGRTGGVSISVNEAVTRLFPDKAKLFTSTQSNGIIECKKLLESAKEGKVDARFIEGMGCIGGCVGGPKAIISKEEGRERLNSLAESSKIKISLDSDVMYTILKKLGINSAADFKGEKAEIFERKL